MTIILGGGISGLSAAYYAAKSVKAASVNLLEASNRVGGWIRSRISPSGVIFEQGPRTIRLVGIAGKNTLNLIEDLQLTDKLIHIKLNHPAIRNRLIYSDGALHLLPTSLKGIFKTTSLLDRPLINYLWTELRARKISKEDESMYSFFERRFGQDIADNLISPMVCGICAGDAREISVKFLFKSLFEMEQKHGSVVKSVLLNGLRKILKLKANSANTNDTNDENAVSYGTLVARAQKENWALWTLQGGLELLPQTLADNLKKQGIKIQMKKKCEKLTFKSDHVEILVNDSIQECSRVISSLCAKDLAKLVQEQHPRLSTELEAIPTVTVGIVNLEFQEDILPLQAFGFLVPPKENLPLLGVVFDSCVVPQKSTTVYIYYEILLFRIPISYFFYLIFCLIYIFYCVQNCFTSIYNILQMFYVYISGINCNDGRCMVQKIFRA